MSLWAEEPVRLALLALWRAGRLRRREGCGLAFDELLRLPWTRRTGRRDELALEPTMRAELEALLDGAWPGWRDAAARLEARGLPADERGWRRLADLERRAALPPLPARLNLRTATAAVGPHSKAGLGDARREGLGDVEVTRDGVVRLRPHPGLRLVRGEVALEAADVAAVLGEVAIAERALRDGTRLEGPPPAALLLVENKGAFVDLTPPSGWLVAHVPGWDTATLGALLAQLPGVPVVHFGDLDPNGVRIARHLRALCPGLVWAVPPLWADHAPARALPRPWPPDLDLADTPALVRDLAARGLWLEQEPLALDPRLPAALAALLPGAEPADQPPEQGAGAGR